ncbi:HPP family-domain-containing protein [Kockovaella imperatae]|uniref:HPP family-domain-containing protein n=1 Tax=Kockovaella imperatae TaxID=4999 RepID=A0A1Y1UET1_9TREE|nr:HPP family-domain-containing protein [Kockovaella imperatae]ORX36016.1 HPP family-domain-containing protein [Kockovaella imperatae]
MNPKPHRLAHWPPIVSRFLGYRSTPTGPWSPLPFPPFAWLPHLPYIMEKYMFGFIGSFVSLFLIQLAMTLPHSAFSSVYHSPIIIGSFGASAVLVFGAFEVPLAQPRNLVGGHFISALIGVCLTKLFALDPGYHAWVDEADRGVFHVVVIVNGCLSMALALLAMDLLGVIHPPAGATALLAAVSPSVVRLSWHYLPVIIVSSLIMLGVGLINNNVGRKRYPMYWVKPAPPPPKPNNPPEVKEGIHDNGDQERTKRDIAGQA